MRSLSEPGQYDNQVEAAELQLPTSGANPVEHYRSVARHLDLEQPRAASRRARSFARAACTDWQRDEIREQTRRSE